MKNFLLTAMVCLAIVGCTKAPKDDPTAIKVNGKVIADKYQLSLYATKPNPSFSITIEGREYIKFRLDELNVQEGIFDSGKVKIIDDGKTKDPYAIVIWKNMPTNNFNSYSAAFSNATEVYIYTMSHTSDPLNAEY